MKIQAFLESQGVPFTALKHRPTYDAQRTAQVLHVHGNEMAKTVLLRANGGYVYVVAVLPATKKIDLEKTREVLGGAKVELATEVEISEHCPDCEIGALPPFGSQYDMKTIVDESLAEDDEIVFEGNTHEEAIRMKYADFARVEQPLVADFARDSH
jgi:Ala-tRNA(Pro) deacylase